MNYSPPGRITFATFPTPPGLWTRLEETLSTQYWPFQAWGGILISSKGGSNISWWQLIENIPAQHFSVCMTWNMSRIVHETTDSVIKWFGGNLGLSKVKLASLLQDFSEPLSCSSMTSPRGSAIRNIFQIMETLFHRALWRTGVPQNPPCETWPSMFWSSAEKSNTWAFVFS